jgi:predicted phosphodiesterase
MKETSGLRVAALYDIHANAPALRAVLDGLERELVDLIVFGGDVVPGPLPAQTIELLRPLRDRAVFIRGNTDRWVVEAFDALAGDADAGMFERRPAAAWGATTINRGQRDFLASFEASAVIDVDGLGPTLFCHGSPRSDQELLTAITPARRWRPMLSGVEQGTVVCGHTHSQFDCSLGSWRVINAGSVGMPFEKRSAAYWALLGPDVELRRTDYDIEAAVPELRAGGWPGADDFLRRSLLEPADPVVVARAYEEEAEKVGIAGAAAGSLPASGR